jgi:hypothetical protein
LLNYALVACLTLKFLNDWLLLACEALVGIVFIKAQERQSHMQRAEGEDTDAAELPAS